LKNSCIGNLKTDAYVPIFFPSDRKDWLASYHLTGDQRLAFINYSKKVGAQGQSMLHEAWRMKLQLQVNQVELKKVEEEKVRAVKALEEEKFKLKSQLEKYIEKFGPLPRDDEQS
jgi:hypothetical protein